MEILKTIIWVIEIISAMIIVVLVLLQHGKGADAGATFGSGGGSGSLFGASGSANFLSHTTAIFATIFFVSTFVLVLLLSHGRVGDAGVMAHMNNKVVASNVVVNPVAAKTVTSNTSEVNKAIPASTAQKVVASAVVTHKENQIPQ